MRKVFQCCGMNPSSGLFAESKVYRNSELNVYVVRFFSEEMELKDAEYETDSKADAIGTAMIHCGGETANIVFSLFNLRG